MKIIPLSLLLLFSGWSVAGHAQRNVSKTNVLFGPFFKSIRTSQEVKIGSRFSTQTTAKVRPASSFRSGALGIINVDGAAYNPFSNAKLSSVGNSTEFRIYSKKKGAMRGFYFGPYFSYTFIKLQSATVPGQFHDSNGVQYTADLTQVIKLNVTGGGIQCGVQGVIKNRFVIDWTMAGIGLASFNLKGGVDATNTSGNFDFRNYPDDVAKATFGVEKILPFTKTVEKESISLGVKIPFPLIKMGLSVGFGYGGVKPKMPKTDMPSMPGTGTGTGSTPQTPQTPQTP